MVRIVKLPDYAVGYDLREWCGYTAPGWYFRTNTPLVHGPYVNKSDASIALEQYRQELETVGLSIPAARCGAYYESYEWLDRPKGWQGCSRLLGHEGNHSDFSV